MRKRILRLLAAVSVGAIALSGCAAQNTNSAVETKQLTYLEPQAWMTLYPPAGGFYPNGGIINQITDRLLYQDPETLELHPWIAAKLPEINATATEYTFELRRGVTYSDGTKLDAANVAKNFDLYAKGDISRGLNPSETINNYERSEVLDEHTVKFYFSAPSPGFAQATSTINTGLISNDSLEMAGSDFAPGNAKKISGSGPFVIDSEKLGSELKLVKRPDYNWAPPVRKHQGAAKLDSIKFALASEASVRVGSVVSGQADIARQIDAPDEKQFAKDNLAIYAASTNGVTNSLSFRFGHPALNDIRVRQALIAGIDRKAIIDTLFTPSYPLAKGILAQGALGHIDTSKHYKYDPKLAAKLLKEAGFAKNADGVLVKDGIALELTFNDALPHPRSKEVVALLQQQLDKLGVKIDSFAGDQASQDQARYNLDTIQVYHSMVGRADYDVLKTQFYSKNRNVLLNLNPATGEIFDPELDRLIEQVASEADLKARNAASVKVQEYLAEKALVLPLFEEPQVFGMQRRVVGFMTEATGRPSFYEVSLKP